MSWIGPSLSSSDGLTRPPPQIITRSDGSVISSLSSLASPSRIQMDPTNPLAILARNVKKVNDLVFAVSDKRRFRPLTIPLLFAAATKWWDVTVEYFLRPLSEEEVEWEKEFNKVLLDQTFEETITSVFNFFGSRLTEEVLDGWMQQSGIGFKRGVPLLPDPEIEAIHWAFHDVTRWFEERLRSKDDVMKKIYSINQKYKSY